MRILFAKLSLRPTPKIPARSDGTNSSGGVTQAPTAQNPAILTEDGKGILTEDGRVILEP